MLRISTRGRVRQLVCRSRSILERQKSRLSSEKKKQHRRNAGEAVSDKLPRSLFVSVELEVNFEQSWFHLNERNLLSYDMKFILFEGTK